MAFALTTPGRVAAIMAVGMLAMMATLQLLAAVNILPMSSIPLMSWDDEWTWARCYLFLFHAVMYCLCGQMILRQSQNTPHQLLTSTPEEEQRQHRLQCQSWFLTFYAALYAALILSSSPDHPLIRKYSFGAIYIVLAICCAIVSSNSNNALTTTTKTTDADADADNPKHVGPTITADPEASIIPLIKANTHT